MKVRELNRQQICVFNDDDELIAGVNLGRYRPWIYPLFTPSGQNVLREFPPDHGFHNGAFFGHYPLLVNDVGHNFWGAPPFRDENDEMGKHVGIVQSSLRDIVIHKQCAQITLNCNWITDKKEEVIQEVRTYRLSVFPDYYLFKTTSILKNIHPDVITFEKTKCSGHAMRLSHDFCLVNGAKLYKGAKEASVTEVHGQSVPDEGLVIKGSSKLRRSTSIIFTKNSQTIFFLRNYGLTTLNPFFQSTMRLGEHEYFEFSSEVILSDFNLPL